MPITGTSTPSRVCDVTQEKDVRELVDAAHDVEVRDVVRPGKQRLDGEEDGQQDAGEDE